MKKVKLLFGLMLGLVLLLSGCEKEIVSTALVVDETQTATIKFYVKAEFDAQNTEYESVSGQEIRVSVRRNDLNPYFSGQGRWSTTIPISSGVATVEVPASEDGCTIYIDVLDFEHSFTDAIGENYTMGYYYNSGLTAMAGSSFIQTIVLNNFPI